MSDPIAELPMSREAHPHRGTVPKEALPMTAEREMQLAVRIKAGDPAAREELILANLGLVRNIASAFRGHNRIVDINDLLQEGNLGLLRAASDFDPEAHGTRFVNYASCWIRYRIRRVLAEQATTIRYPYYLVLLRRRFERIRERLIASNEAKGTTGGDPDAEFEQVVERMGVEGRRLKFLRSIRDQLRPRAMISINEPSQEPALARSDPPQMPLEIAESMEGLYAAMRQLTLLESWVLRRRYRLDDSCPRAEKGIARKKNPRGNQRASVAGANDKGKRTYRVLSSEIGMPIHQLRAIERTALSKLHRLLTPRSAEDSAPSSLTKALPFGIRIPA